MGAFLKNFDLVPLDILMIPAGALLFFLFNRAFSRIFVEPFKAVLSARDHATTGAVDEARHNLERASELNAQYENALTQVRIEAMQKKLTIVTKAKEDAAKIVHEAEAKAHDFMKTARAETERQETELRARALHEAEPLAQMLAQKVRSSLTTVAVLVCAILIAANNSFAAEEHAAAHHAAEHHVAVPPFGEFMASLGFYWANLLIYVVAVIVLVRKPLAKAMVARRLSVEGQVQNARASSEAAQAQLSAAQQKLATLTQSSERVRKEIEHETTQESRAILEDATTRAARIERQAKDLAAAERRSSEKRIEQELVERALSSARQKLEHEMTADQDKNVRLSVLGKVQGLIQ